MWVVWPMVSDSLPPQQSASGGPASQRNSTPTASVRMSEGQELIHASRIIRHGSYCSIMGARWLSASQCRQLPRALDRVASGAPSSTASQEPLIYFCLYGFNLVSLALGEMYEGELLPRVHCWLVAEREYLCALFHCIF